MSVITLKDTVNQVFTLAEMNRTAIAPLIQALHEDGSANAISLAELLENMAKTSSSVAHDLRELVAVARASPLPVNLSVSAVARSRIH